MSTPDSWIVIPNWSEFQHYKNRDPSWIKAYTRLLTDDEYMHLTYRQRGILHSLWLLYAAADGVVRCSDVGAMLARGGQKQGERPIGSRDLDALNHAGFIEISASKPLALRYQAASPEVEKEKKELPTSKEPTRARATQPAATQYERENPWKCPGCSIRERSEQALRDHLENVHWLQGDKLEQAMSTASA